MGRAPVMAATERHRRCRVVFMACFAVIVSVSSSEAPMTSNVSPQEIGGNAILGESQTAPTVAVPLAVVRSFAKRVEAENKHLMQENTALRAQGLVDEAKQSVAVAGGLMEPIKKEDKKKSLI